MESTREVIHCSRYSSEKITTHTCLIYSQKDASWTQRYQKLSSLRNQSKTFPQKFGPIKINLSFSKYSFSYHWTPCDTISSTDYCNKPASFYWDKADWTLDPTSLPISANKTKHYLSPNSEASISSASEEKSGVGSSVSRDGLKIIL